MFDRFLVQQLLQYARIGETRTLATILDRRGEVDCQLTLGSWLQKSARFASGLAKLGVQANDTVVIAAPTSEDFLVAFLGTLWRGAIAVPVPEPDSQKQSHADRLTHVIRDCQPARIVLSSNTVEASYRDLVSTVDELCGVRGADVPPPYSPKADDIAFIQYTSGSTNDPKGVIVTHGALRANCEAMGKASGMGADDRILTWMPLYHDMGLVGGVLFPAYFGLPFYLLPTHAFLGNPFVWLKSISMHEITLSTGVNFAYSLCGRRLRKDKVMALDLSRWRLAYNGAEPIDPKTFEVFEAKLASAGFRSSSWYPVYGMAEATLAISFPDPGTGYKVDTISRHCLVADKQAVPVHGDDSDAMPIVCVGKSLPEHRVCIREVGAARELPERHVGEVCFSGPSVSRGYFSASGQHQRSGDELRTGDLGYLHGGELYIVDRVKDMIQIAGENYYPSDIERQVFAIEGVRENRVVAFEMRDKRVGTGALAIVAEVVENRLKEQISREIVERIHAVIGLVPRQVVLVPRRTIPLTSSGKLMRQKCRDLYLAGAFDGLSSTREVAGCM